MVDQLSRAIRQAHTIDGRRNRFTASMGAVRYPHDGTTAEELLIKAEIAMYSAKSMGRNRCHLFEGRMAEDFEQRVYTERILRKALESDGFRLVYQPIVHADTGALAYLEALLRLEGHDLSPAVFIGVAEEFDLIQPIGRWVIRTAIGQLVSWEQAGQALKPISINLSPRQFYDTGLVDFLRDTLELHNLDPSLIEMESPRLSD